MQPNSIKLCADLVRDAIGLHPDLPAENLAEGILWKAHPSLLVALASKEIIREILTERRKQQAEHPR